MSGFAGVIHLDGAPVDRSWLEAMAEVLACRGPDGTEIRISGNAGFCHALLQTRTETEGRPPIASLDGCVWIAGDVRIDDRETLIARLPGAAQDLKTASSAELILHAYALWGPACVEHVLGDFSFVIWDARRRLAFAARDHLGVRPLYYAHVGNCLIVSNTLDAIRKIPIVPAELDDRAIGDFLLVGMNRYPDSTFFTAIRRLPVAHRLIARENAAGESEVRAERYWTLPVEDPVYYRRAGDYVDRFLELVRLAVRDRLPGGPLGVLMSGGLDSPLLAATAAKLGAATTAFTCVFDRLIPDQERHYAGLVANYIGIPIHFSPRDDEPWGWQPGSPPIHTPEPWADPLMLAANREFYYELSAHARVFFYGIGPDAAMYYEWRPNLDYLIRHRKWGRLGRDLISDFLAYPRVPFFHRLPRMWRERKRSQTVGLSLRFPSWMNQDFTARLGLRDRWEEIRNLPRLPHPTRPESYSNFAEDFPMGGVVERLDAGNTGAPADSLHPFWDIRLVRCLLTVPAVPWCREKYLIRTALRGLVPEVVRLRPKTPLAGDPYLKRIRQYSYPELPPTSGLDRYVTGDPLSGGPGTDRDAIDGDMRILGLHYWLLGL